ncbi:rhomboid family intramembrane serine protease [Streptomyces gamaensis]|uniref:Rhomboid family intramembrane serine protease n=1 Tax=Streptomyces gamaensis TaxID=1763542 RepID=A0ABW0Z8A2_9ACTN
MTGTAVRRVPAGQRPAPPWITYGIIGTCCVVFLAGPAAGFVPLAGRPEGTGRPGGSELLAEQTAYFERWGVVPAALWHGSPQSLITPLTALFVHGNWLHLLGNMLFLYVFGAMAEQHMGRRAFALFYLAVGAAALLGYAAAHAHSTQTLVGASGAISGVLGAFLYLFPRARVTSLFPFLFFLPLRFPAWMVLLFWFALQWLAARSAGDRPQVAYLAHVIGFALGFLYAWARYTCAARVKVPVPSDAPSAAARDGGPGPDGAPPPDPR